MKNVSELKTEPVVGRFYVVRCYRQTAYRSWSKLWWPLIGPEHDDAELLNFPMRHIHFDFRFINASHTRYWKGHGARESLPKLMGRVQNMRCPGEFAERVMRCNRLMPDFPSEAVFIEKLEDAYQSETLKCLKCPHRGVPLNGLPAPHNVVVCPGHGLAWNIKTGVMVRRAKPVEAS